MVTPKLSIIIVNYNVSFFLGQCLHAVERAINNIPSEVFVVDNNSSDNSVEMVKRDFPTIHLIANKENVGFSKANNQAIKIAKGEHILLLNPDTIVEEETFKTCIDFMEERPDIGGLGVRMIDGNGKFLPESKRGLPTPSVAFYKVSGLSVLFPKSKKFAKYHLGHLPEHETNEIEILSGAYMWIRKKVLDKVGYLDETFFMYGEDIDLSYRILKAGYKNYYLPKARIIHYKGESTKKGSINYVFVFYRAMVIFTKKHFANKFKLFPFFINLAIFLRASAAVLSRFFNKLTPEFVLLSLFIFTFYYLSKLLPDIAIPITDSTSLVIRYFCLIPFLILSVFRFIKFQYNKFIAISLMIGYLFVIPLILLKHSSFFTITYTAIIALLTLATYWFIRKTQQQKKVPSKHNKVFVGTINQFHRISKKTASSLNKVIPIKPNNIVDHDDDKTYKGRLYQAADIAEVFDAGEIIFDSSILTYTDILSQIDQIKEPDLDAKIIYKDKTLISSKTIEHL